MTYKEYKERMLEGLQDEIRKQILSDVIDCHEGMGLSVSESAEIFKIKFMKESESK